jgi:hypothetical protein
MSDTAAPGAWTTVNPRARWQTDLRSTPSPTIVNQQGSQRSREEKNRQRDRSSSYSEPETDEQGEAACWTMEHLWANLPQRAFLDPEPPIFLETKAKQEELIAQQRTVSQATIDKERAWALQQRKKKDLLCTSMTQERVQLSMPKSPEETGKKGRRRFQKSSYWHQYQAPRHLTMEDFLTRRMTSNRNYAKSD